MKIIENRLLKKLLTVQIYLLFNRNLTVHKKIINEHELHLRTKTLLILRQVISKRETLSWKLQKPCRLNHIHKDIINVKI